jgi:uncharacterized protein
MPVTPTYPGVYIEEIPSGVRTIVGVATSITAFVGSAPRGPTNMPTSINNFGEFERAFGPLRVNDLMGYSVRQFFLNGGNQGLIVRVADKEAISAEVDVGNLPLKASGEGRWGNLIRARIDWATSDSEEQEPKLFNLFLQYRDEDSEDEIREVFRNVSTNRDHPRYVKPVLEERSRLVRLRTEENLPPRPSASGDPPPEHPDPFDEANKGATHVVMTKGGDGGQISNLEILGDEKKKTGIFALEKADLFNLLCLPPPERGVDIEPATYAAAIKYCEKRRAMLLVDSPADWLSISDAQLGFSSFVSNIRGSSKNGAMFFPRIKAVDPLKENLLSEFAPCGVIAGICARTDVQRGVWKSPAGLDAALTGVTKLSYTMTDDENGRLNPLGLNCLRTFPVYGHVVWGSRTLDGADRLTSEWKYLAVRRFTLFIEESLYQGTQWVVFEPNDEPLWSQIRLAVGSFMQTLFRQGAFQGNSPSKAYFVKCDAETTTQDDIDRGIVNIHVGFCPLKPAEFVILKIQQMSGRETDN